MEQSFFLLLIWGLLATTLCLLCGLRLTLTLFRRQAMYFAPVVGMLLLTATAHLLFYFSTQPLLCYALPLAILALSAVKLPCQDLWRSLRRTLSGNLIVAFLCCMLIAALTAQAGFLKIDPQAGTFSQTAFFGDHGKDAIIASMVLDGLPVINPFFVEPVHLHYYYLYYVFAAFNAQLFSLTAYQSAVATHFCTIFITVLFVMGLAREICRKCSVLITSLFLCSGGSLLLLQGQWAALVATPPVQSLRSLKFIDNLFGNDFIAHDGIQSFLHQCSWVPQHVCAALLLLFAVLLIQRYVRFPHFIPRITTLFLSALSVAAALGCSVFVGGFVAALSLSTGALWLLWQFKTRRRELLLFLLSLAVLAVFLSVPFLQSMLPASSSGRSTAFALRVFNWSKSNNLLLNLLGSFTVFLFMSNACLALGFFVSCLDKRRFKRLSLLYFAAFGSLFCTLFLSSGAEDMDNNTFWRAVLPFLLASAVLTSALCAWHKSAGLKHAILILCGICLVPSVLTVSALTGGNGLSQPIIPNKVFETIKEMLPPDSRYLADQRTTLAAEGYRGNFILPALIERRSCLVSDIWIRPFTDQRLFALVPAVKALMDGMANNDVINRIRTGGGCTHLLVFKNNVLFGRSELLTAAGLTPLYASNDVEIYLF